MKHAPPLAGTVLALIVAAPLLSQEPGTPMTSSDKAPWSPPPVRKEVVVPAAASEVWKAFTTTEGIKTFFAPGGSIELKAGGPYEIYFSPEAPAGSKGCEGCTVVSFEPESSLVFTWSYPPTLPALRTAKLFGTVTVSLAPDGEGKTAVTLVHGGFPPSRDGAKARTYFVKAWDVVTQRLVQRFTTGPIDWSKQ